MNEHEENYELEINFDPNKLKVSELRGLLNKYEVSHFLLLFLGFLMFLY